MFPREAPLDGLPTVTLEARSWEKAGSGPDEDGEREVGVEFCEWNDTALLSDGAKGLAARGACPWAWAWPREWTGGGGARPLPLPRTLPPPSFRADMDGRCRCRCRCRWWLCRRGCAGCVWVVQLCRIRMIGHPLQSSYSMLNAPCGTDMVCAGCRTNRRGGWDVVVGTWTRQTKALMRRSTLHGPLPAFLIHCMTGWGGPGWLGRCRSSGSGGFAGRQQAAKAAKQH